MSNFFVFLFACCFLNCNGQVTSIDPSLYLSINEGEDAVFSCSGSGPHLLQFNNNITSHTRLVELSSEDSTGSGDNGGGIVIYYSFNDTDRYDNGTTIQCFFNGISTNVLTILVDYPPRYDPTLSTYRVMAGSSPQLLLHLSAFPDVTQYTWRKDGIIIQSDNRITLHVNGLIFNGISTSDSGQYTVTTSDQQGQATIIVVVYHAPVFIEGNDIVNKSVVIGNDITLSCDVMATPTITDLTLSYNNNEANVVINDNTFIITDININNNGPQYTCTAENEVGIRQLTYNLIVKESPTPSTAVPTTTTTVPTNSPTNTPGSGAERPIGVVSTMVLLLLIGLNLFF